MNARIIPIVSCLVFALPSCGAPTSDSRDKDKVELRDAEGFAKTAISPDDIPGPWAEIRTIDTRHPYTNNYSNSVTVSGSPDASHIRVVFERFELETGYDFLRIDSHTGNASEHTGTKTGHVLIVEGNEIRLRFSTDYSVTAWGVRLVVYERVPCICPEIYSPVCGSDGVTYGNACEAACAGVATQRPSAGPCAQRDWTEVFRGLESDHPYENYFRQQWTLSEGGADRIRAHFSRIDLETGYDFLRILDANGTVVETYTGNHRDITTPTIAGSTMRIELVTDYSVTRWGFELDYYEVQGGCYSDSECGTGKACVQVQCFRAPCFAICMPTGDTERVDLADLLADPHAFDGHRIAVEGEPAAGPAMCTLMACSQANPCCNMCSSNLLIGDNIALARADGTAMGCSGNECDYQGQCDPFPGIGSGPYRLEGLFEVGAYDALRLLVDSFEATDCQRGGCSGQACSNGGPVITTCEYRPEYACYAGATCGAQESGYCGWTQTPELLACLANPTGNSEVVAVSTDTPLLIPDYPAAGVRSQIEILAGSGVNVAQEIQISVAIVHTYRGDLTVTLVAPDGTEAVLHDREGGGANDVRLDNVDVPQLSATAAVGTWQLHVRDSARYDTGVIENWRLTLRD